MDLWKYQKQTQAEIIQSERATDLGESVIHLFTRIYLFINSDQILTKKTFYILSFNGELYNYCLVLTS
jgi:hypothetical protein